MFYDGWIIRFANGYTRRANSVIALYESRLPVIEKINQCEALYTAQGLGPVFKLTEASCPAGLDTALADRGYMAQARTSVQTVDLAALDLKTINIPHLTLTHTATPEWITAFMRLSSIDGQHTGIITELLCRMAFPVAYATITQDDEIVAVGLGICGLGYIGLFDVVTEPAYRNRRFGRQIVRRLLNWGQGQGARQGFLQVLADNAPARYLYGTVGFREMDTYWYRVRQ